MALSIHEALKALFPDDIVKTLEAALKDQTVSIVPTEDYIPKSRFDTVSASEKKYKADYEKSVTDLEALKPLAAGSEALTKQIQDLQTQHKESTTKYEAQIVAQQREFALTNSLGAFKPKNIKAVKALLDAEAISKLPIKDDKLDGFEAIMQPIIKDNSYLFGDVQQQPAVDRLGNPISQPGNKTTLQEAMEIAGKYVDPKALEKL